MFYINTILFLYKKDASCNSASLFSDKKKICQKVKRKNKKTERVKNTNKETHQNRFLMRGTLRLRGRTKDPRNKLL